MRLHAPACLILTCLALACGGPGAPKPESPATVRVAAASDLQFALEEADAGFRAARPGARVEVTFGSSGAFFAQISNGAPFDVFLSADAAYPRRLADAGRADPATLAVYAVGRIVVWVPNDSPLRLEALGMSALADPSVRKIAIPNPEHAPYGRAAEAAMRSLGVYDAVRSRLVLGESVSQAAQFVESGAADAGVIARSLALAPPMLGKGRAWEVPADSYPRLEQAGVVLAGASDPAAARAYLDGLTSPDGRAALARHGFSAPGE